MSNSNIRPAGNGPRSDTARRGFTFVELVVVISVIAALAAIGFPAWAMISTRVKINATEALVQSVATSITTYQAKTWTWVDSSTNRPRTYHIFDLNHFHPTTNAEIPDLEDTPDGTTNKWFSIDGYVPGENTSFYDASQDVGKEYINAPTETDPNRNPNPPPYDVNFSRDILNSGYRGFIAMAQPSIKPSFINKRGQVVDAWKRPLRIAYAARVFGTQPFGVWSAGLDGKDHIVRGTGSEKDTYKDATGPEVKTIDDLRSWGGDKGGK